MKGSRRKSVSPPQDLAAELAKLTDKLSEADPKDRVWQHVDDFISRLAELKAQKSAALNELQLRDETIAQARSLVTNFLEGNADRLKFHELNWPQALAPASESALGLDQAALVIESLPNLDNLLAKYEDLFQNRPLTRTGLRQQNADLEEIEARLVAAFTDLVRRLSGAPEPPHSDGSTSPGLSATTSDQDEFTPEETEQEAPPTGLSEDTQDLGGKEASVIPGVATDELACNTEPAAPVPSTPERPLSEDSAQSPAEELAPNQPPSEPSAAPVEELFWQSVAKGDLATAFWLSFTQGEEACRVAPPWIARACFLASMVKSPGDDASNELATIIYERPSPLADPAFSGSGLASEEAQLLVVLASLRPSLMAPETGASSWLVEGGPPELRPLLSAVHDFSSTGVSLNKASVHGNKSKHMVEQTLTDSVGQANRWLTVQKNSHLRYPPAAKVVHRLASETTDIGRAASAVALDSRDQIAFVRGVLKSRLSNHTSMGEVITEQTRLSTHGPTVPRITGPILETLLTRLEELAGIIERWVDGVESDQTLRPDWRDQQVALFRSRFLQAWHEMGDRTETGSVSLPLRALRDSVWEQLRAIAAELQFEASSEAGSEVNALDYKRCLVAPLLVLDHAPVNPDGSAPSGIGPDTQERWPRRCWPNRTRARFSPGIWPIGISCCVGWFLISFLARTRQA